MIDYKKIGSIKEFRESLRGSVFSGRLLVVAMLLLLLLDLLSTWLFPRMLFPVMHGPAFIYVFVGFLGIFGIARAVLIRFLLALGAAYLVTKNSERLKKSTVGMWEIVNTYLYAFIVVVAVGMGIFILVRVVSIGISSILPFVGWFFTTFFDIGVVGLSGYWLYERIISDTQSATAVEGKVVGDVRE